MTKLINDGAFISEVNALGSDEGGGDEYVEITIKATENLNDYVLGFYVADTGALVPGPDGSSGNIAGSSFFPNQGEFTLGDVSAAVGGVGGSVPSSVGGLPLSIIEHPDDAQWLIIQVPASMIRNDTETLNQGANTVALTYTPTSESIVYNVQGGTTTALVDGAAAGALQEATLAADTRIDIRGDQFVNGRTPGTSTLCLTDETRVLTPFGEVACAQLQVGDLLCTVDNGPQPIRWIKRQRFDKTALRENPKLYPVKIAAGALGDQLPARDLIVSRQHRILINSDIALRLTGRKSVLLPAIRLTPLNGVEVDESVEEITYVHLLFDRHELVRADGAIAESLLLAPGTRSVLDSVAIREIKALFPDHSDWIDSEPARMLVDGQKAKDIVRRHVELDKPVLIGKRKPKPVNPALFTSPRNATFLKNAKRTEALTELDI